MEYIPYDGWPPKMSERHSSKCHSWAHDHPLSEGCIITKCPLGSHICPLVETFAEDKLVNLIDFPPPFPMCSSFSPKSWSLQKSESKMLSLFCDCFYTFHPREKTIMAVVPERHNLDWLSLCWCLLRGETQRNIVSGVDGKGVPGIPCPIHMTLRRQIAQ